MSDLLLTYGSGSATILGLMIGGGGFGIFNGFLPGTIGLPCPGFGSFFGGAGGAILTGNYTFSTWLLDISDVNSPSNVFIVLELPLSIGSSISSGRGCC